MAGGRSPRRSSSGSASGSPVHRKATSLSSIKVEPFRSSSSLYNPGSNGGLYSIRNSQGYHARPGSWVRAVAISWLPTPLRRLLYLHPTAYLIPCFLFFFLIASSSLSQSPDNHPLEILQELPLHPFAAFNVKCHDAPHASLVVKPEYVDDVLVGQDHKVTAIVLHGFNDRNQWTDPLKAALPYVKWVHPKGRTINITANEGHASPAWYDIKTYHDVHEDEDRSGMLETQRQLNQLIKRERSVFEQRGETPRIVVGGFGQGLSFDFQALVKFRFSADAERFIRILRTGATMAILSALTSAEPLDAVIALSGYVPVPSKALEIASTVRKSTPIFWGHGRKDSYFSAEAAENDANALQLPPYSLTNVDFRTYEGLEHFWRADEVNDLIGWLRLTVQVSDPVEFDTEPEAVGEVSAPVPTPEGAIETDTIDEDGDELDDEDAQPLKAGFGRPNPGQVGGATTPEKGAVDEDDDGTALIRVPIKPDTLEGSGSGRKNGPKRLLPAKDAQDDEQEVLVDADEDEDEPEVSDLGGRPRLPGPAGGPSTPVLPVEAELPLPASEIAVDTNEDGHVEDTLSDLVKEAQEAEAPAKAGLLDTTPMEDELQDLPLEEQAAAAAVVAPKPDDP
ncbi:BQ2448_4747 [Microbotryum intermedium]|uniref:Acyl-protein thioesterase 1 n=1 Tax=Microbotryum intermedium TaxID=269621 RepID=A0A238FJ73_9BASI|nr:BQ2448_4747 [Microbotryum intermedium]